MKVETKETYGNLDGRRWIAFAVNRALDLYNWNERGYLGGWLKEHFHDRHDGVRIQLGAEVAVWLVTFGLPCCLIRSSNPR